MGSEAIAVAFSIPARKTVRSEPWLIRGSTCGQIRAKARPGFLKAFA